MYIECTGVRIKLQVERERKRMGVIYLYKEAHENDVKFTLGRFVYIYIHTYIGQDNVSQCILSLIELIGRRNDVFACRNFISLLDCILF